MLKENEPKSSGSASASLTPGPHKRVTAKYTAQVSSTNVGFSVQLTRPASTFSLYEWGAQPVGQAAVKLSNQEAVAAPGEEEVYRSEHVLGARPGMIAYLDNIKNFSVLTDEPGDIYQGVGTVLLHEAEKEARRRGAVWIYLIASPTAARTDPNSATKTTTDPAGFYAKCGYKQDETQFAHNERILIKMMEGSDADAIRAQGRRWQEALWIKRL